MSALRVQCLECGGISIIPAGTIGERRLLNCPRCYAMTSRWRSVAQPPRTDTDRKGDCT